MILDGAPPAVEKKLYQKPAIKSQGKVEDLTLCFPRPLGPHGRRWRNCS
jgi:hypothetical protein